MLMMLNSVETCSHYISLPNSHVKSAILRDVNPSPTLDN